MLLNADVGEDDSRLGEGRQAALIALVDEVSVACGGHAGDERSMELAVAQALAARVAIGAHPSVPDRAGFGRAPITQAIDDVEAAVCGQLQMLAAVCARAGARIAHIKPHGALYHAACDDDAWALMLVRAQRAAALDVPLVLLAGAPTRARLESEGVPVRAEGFADRGYDEDGRLLPRGAPGALLADPAAAAAQALLLRARGGVDTLCVHGDSPGALAIARAVRDALGPRR